MRPIYGESNKRYTARLATPVEYKCQLSAASVTDVVRGVVDGYTPERGVAAAYLDKNYAYWFKLGSDGIVITCGDPKPGKPVDAGPWTWHWLATVQTVTDGNATELKLALTRWRMLDKRIRRGGAFELFRDRLTEELRAADPGLVVVHFTPEKVATPFGLSL